VVAVRGVDGVVVEDVAVEAAPEHFDPAAAERAQDGVLAFPGRPLLVVEGARPRGAAQAAEGPSLDGVARWRL
jgi:hypothetical protein